MYCFFVADFFARNKAAVAMISRLASRRKLNNPAVAIVMEKRMPLCLGISRARRR